MLLVQLGINSTRPGGSSNFGKISKHHALVLLIPNCTRHRMITYTYNILTRNTCMQQPLAYIFQTLVQHEVFLITPTLNAGSRCTSSC
jgi:hypothetical protein